MDPLRTIGMLLTLASAAVLVAAGAGCSPDPQNAQDANKKIDLTLPKPGGRAEAPQKPAGKSEAAAEKEEKRVEAARAAAERELSNPAASKPNAAPASPGKTKKQAGKKAGKEREAAAISQQQSGTASTRGETVGDGVEPKEQDGRPSEGVEHYQDTDNLLHPSYKKK